jgi:hypothetical protein
MENKPICETDKDGNKWWSLNGKLHREDGPAIIRINGIKEYFIHNKRHRLDGPAWISSVSSFRNEWFINGILVTPEITKWATENNIDLDNLTDVDIALIKISFT